MVKTEKNLKKSSKPEKKQKKTQTNVKNSQRTPDIDDLVFSENELTASVCRESFFEFVKEFWGTVIQEKPVYNWHVQYLCEELQKIAEQVFLGLPKEHDLIINISPGTTKSTICSIMFPAWIWTRMPSARIISASYAYALATDLSRKSRDVIKSDKYRELFPEIVIREDQDAKNHFVNTGGGERYAFGVGGAVLGKHAHFLIVDDPISPAQAVSDADLATANRWMEETLPTRKVDKAVTPTILIMQRLHEADPTGTRLEKADKMPVKHICLPAELTEEVRPAICRDYYIDGLMDPTRLNHLVLREAEAQGDFVYASQYLQTPIPRGGATFIVTKFKKRAMPTKKEIKRAVRYWDKAGTDGGGAYTVGVLFAWLLDGSFGILDIIRVQLDSAERERLIRQTAFMDGRQTHVGMEEEPGSGGKHSSQSTIRNLSGFIARAFKADKAEGSKIMRADPLSVQVNAGNVFIVEAPWNRDFINEFRFFPRSRYKDQVDACSGAYNWIAGTRRVLGGGKVLPKNRRNLP